MLFDIVTYQICNGQNIIEFEPFAFQNVVI